MDTDIILNGLNAAQQAAVTADASVVQILAPPGSGKTKTLTSRVAYLLAHHRYQPWNVLCMTFTIKSAREMKERLARLVGEGIGSRLILGTFHSVCRRYLVRYGHHIGLRKGFGIADSSDSLNAVKRIIKRLQLRIDFNVARNRISKAKARSAGYDDLRKKVVKGQQAKEAEEEFLRVFDEYQAYLEACNLLDYDDLLLRCVELLRKRPDCVSNVEAVLVDEFQDTNSVQFDLMQLFATAQNRITTVGDPDQSIYGWRSAEVENLLKMQRIWPETLVLNLEDNYRSSGSILAAALDVIEQDDSRPPKPLQPTHCLGSRPVFRKLPDAHAQASWTVSEIQRCIQLSSGLLNPSDFAILLRSAAISRLLESCMGKAGLPYRMVGGARFFDRVEIKLLLNYMRVAAHPHNNEAFAAIMNVPSRRIGDNSIRSLVEEAAAKKISLFELAQGIVNKRLSVKTKLLKAGEKGLDILINMILSCREKLADEADFYPDQLLAYLIEQLQFEDYLKRTYPEDEDGRWANVQEFMAQATDSSPASIAENDDALPAIEGVEQADMSNRTEEALTKFLANVALSTELQTDEDDNDTPKERVTISTIHAAKGLEWPIVFVPSVFEGMIPHSRAEDCDEERRLLYVAMTRAQAMLYMSFPEENPITNENTQRSPFVPNKLLQQRFAKKGPALDFSDVEAIATILGRQAPTEEALNCARIAAHHVDDDLWSADDTAYSRRSQYDAYEESGYSYANKRQKFGGFQNEGYTVHSSSVPRHRLPNTDSAGFASASNHMRGVSGAPGLGVAGNGGYGALHGAKRQANAEHQNAKMHAQALNNPWKRPVATQSGLGLPALTLLAAGQHSLMSRPEGAQTTANGLGKDRAVGATTLGHPPMQPHSISRAGSSRPKAFVNPTSVTPYSLLSSSPSRPTHDEQDQKVKEPADHGKENIQAGARPATTLHNTSMSQMRAGGASGVRRTLGVTRGGNGWSGGGMRPFRPPTMSGPGRRGPGA